MDSRDSPAVQLSDVMIGAAIDGANIMAGLRTGSLDPEAISEIYADGQFIRKRRPRPIDFSVAAA